MRRAAAWRCGARRLRGAELSALLPTLLASLLASALAGATAPVPPDWAADAAAANLFFSASEPADPGLYPPLGNGYLATTPFSPWLFVAGLFNGRLSTDPSHSASVPSPAAVNVTALASVSGPLAFVGAAVNVRTAAYLRRWATGDGAVSVTSATFALATRPHSLVVEFDVAFAPGAPQQSVILAFAQSPLSKSPDLALEPLDVDGAVAMNGSTLVAELPNGTLTTLALVTSAVPEGPVTVSQNTSLTFVTTVFTSLDELPPGSTPASAAVAEWQAVSATPGLLAEHEAAWAQRWFGTGGTGLGIDVEGDSELAGAVNMTLFTIFSSPAQFMSPGGLARPCYNGHTFWDCEMWVVPGATLLDRTVGEGALAYREARLAGAAAKAQSYGDGWRGAMFPWESASSGEETCPTWAGTGLREQHISGDIVYAVRHQWRLTGDRAWLKSVGAPIVMGVAQFWASRVTENPDGTFSINDVIPPDEYHDHVNDSVFTNAVAALSLTFASELCAEFGVTGCDPTWPTIAAALRMPFDAVNQRFLEFANYTGDTIKQADVVLLDYPLELNLSETVRRNDLDYYGARTDPNGPAMTWSMHAIGYLALGDRTNGDSFFRRAYSQYLQPPFRVWWETPQGGCENFLTGAGGFLQALLFGYPGLRVTDHGLVFTDPQLPPGVTRFAVRGADYQGTRFGVAIDADGVSFTLGTVGDPPLCVTASGGASPTPLANGLRLAGLAGFTVAPCGTQG